MAYHDANNDVFIKTLVQSLDGKTSLRHINLAGCGLSEADADLLLNFMKKNSQVSICIAENDAISGDHPIYKLDSLEAEHSGVDLSDS